jgi:hypothetical protein
LQGIVIRDTYPDRVQLQCLVTTDLGLTPHELHANSCDRWGIEESFMDLTRYWGLETWSACTVPSQGIAIRGTYPFGLPRLDPPAPVRRRASPAS